MADYRTHLSADFVRSVLNYDPETGILTWKYRDSYPKQWNTRQAGKEAGHISGGYRAIQIEGRSAHKAHRLAWLITHGEWPKCQIDHINMDRSDNRLCNLRCADYSQNNANRTIRSTNSSGHKGAIWHKHRKKWTSRIVVRGKRIALGYYSTAEEASEAYKAAELKYREGFHRI